MKNNNEWYKANILNSKDNGESQKLKQEKYEKANKYIVNRRINLLILLSIILIILVFLVFFYKPNSIDFLLELKNTFTNGIIIILGILVSAIIISNVLIKEKKILSNLLKIILLFNIMFIVIFIGVEANLNKTYNNEEKFGEIYDTKIENKSDKEYIDMWKSLLSMDMKTKTEREIFIDENMSQYTYFRIRVYLVFVLYVITMMANTYMISKIDKGIKGQEKLKDFDRILLKNEDNKEK